VILLQAHWGPHIRQTRKLSIARLAVKGSNLVPLISPPYPSSTRTAPSSFEDGSDWNDAETM